jgi:hypothetical protein
MSIALRLNDSLVHQAEAEGLVAKRSAPKQIEYWAEIGKTIARQINSHDLLAIIQGMAHIHIETTPSHPVNAADVFATIDRQHSSGELTAQVTQAAVSYSASATHPGLLDRITPDGQRKPGRFENGEFIPVS